MKLAEISILWKTKEDENLFFRVVHHSFQFNFSRLISFEFLYYFSQCRVNLMKFLIVSLMKFTVQIFFHLQNFHSHSIASHKILLISIRYEHFVSNSMANEKLIRHFSIHLQHFHSICYLLLIFFFFLLFYDVVSIRDLVESRKFTHETAEGGNEQEQDGKFPLISDFLALFYFLISLIFFLKLFCAFFIFHLLCASLPEKIHLICPNLDTHNRILITFPFSSIMNKRCRLFRVQVSVDFSCRNIKVNF